MTLSSISIRSPILPENVYTIFSTPSITRNGQRVAVETSWTNWTTVNGQAVPGQIVRQENGTTVFTVNVTSGVVSAAAPDNLFVLP
jgi:hypothetical protein